ncbi:MAG TPA: hypothetical protein VK716_13850 [Terracidiphilus sp.]|jgi:hypothetical protein|nr:hypothetical protein [Terracidiphilus sp.]
MKILIQGQDYTAALDAAYPLTIDRKLNLPSACRLTLSLPANGSLPVPQRNQYLSVTGDDGTVYFTGYLAVSPMPEYAGLALQGPRSRCALHAISDELLLDQAGIAPIANLSTGTAGALMTSLVTRTGPATLDTQNLTLNSPVNNVALEPAAPWSKGAGRLATETRAAYRALSAALSLAAIPAATHLLNESDGSLTLANLAFAGNTERALANDVTVCGAHEPAAYVTEYFLGDGISTSFDLAEDPYMPPAAQRALIREQFNESQIDPRLWSNLGGSAYFNLGAGGLNLQGGNGSDGQTTLSWINPIEMGGALLLEATGVTLAAGSAGILPGFFAIGVSTQAACTAGFCATSQQGTGAVSLQPVVMGSTVGTAYVINPANQYALRIRIYCPESERNLSFYRAWDDSGSITFGGQPIAAPALVHFDLQEFINGVAGMPVTLYDGSVANLPTACTVLAAGSLSLKGSMRAISLSNLGPNWVVTAAPGGAPVTRRLGTTAQAAECHLSNTGKLTFYNGFMPPVGEQIAVTYRAIGRAIGRAVNSASQQALAASGLPPVSAWIGTVSSPAVRSSQDCRNAAQTLAQAASSISALWAGIYKAPRTTFSADVWPGDALQINAPSMNVSVQVVIRSVQLVYQASVPDQIEYSIAFANDWADDLAIKSSAVVPADAWLPAPVSHTVLANLNQLAVTSISASTVSLNTGATAPPGGGFEVRRRDYAFQPGSDTDLVVRGAQSAITFNRSAVGDRYYIRMYDGATPPNYSEFSAALFFNLPLGS